MKRLWQWAVALLLILLLLGGGLYLGARYYLTSRGTADQVSSRLQTVLGAPVRVDSVDVGLAGDSSVSGLHVGEAGAADDAPPFLSVKTVKADVSALDLLTGKSNPKEVTLTDAAVDLHFDRDGHLVTHLPSPQGKAGTFPRLHIVKGDLTLSQEGREPMVIRGVTADVTAAGDDLQITGSVADPFWGDWSVSGSFHPEDSAVQLDLHTDRANVDMVKLKALPFAAPVVWEEVQVAGTTPVDLSLNFRTGAPDVHYRVSMAPEDTHVHVKAIDLDADHAHGKVVVEDNVVRLRDVRGPFADGELAVPTADLDFRKESWRLEFVRIDANKVILAKLPKSWLQSLRQDLEGELSGSAAIVVTLDDGKAHLDGSGGGAIDKAKVLGFPASEPIPLELKAEGGKLHLRSKDSVSKLAWSFLTPAIALPPAAPPPPPSPPPSETPPTWLGEFAPSNVMPAAARVVFQVVDKTTGAVGKGMTRAAQWVKRTGPEDAPSYLEAKLTLQDVDLGELLRRLEIKLPFALEGKLSFKVDVSIPVNTPQDMKTYRLNGTADLPRLNIAGLELTDVKTRLRFEEGVLRLEEVSGKAMGGGSFSGDARMEVAPLGDLSANITLDRFPLERVLSLAPGAAGAAGAVSGDVEARASAKTLTDPATWHGSGKLTSDRIQLYGLALSDVSTDLTVREGVGRISGLKGTFAKAPLTGSAELHLSDAWKYTGKLDLTGANLTALQDLAPDYRLPFSVKGAADVSADLKGTLNPATVAASGTAKAADLVVDKVKLDSLSFHWDGDGDRLKLTDLKAKLYQGEVTGSVAVPLREAAAGDVDLHLDDMDVQGLAASLPAIPVRLEGRATGTVKGTIAAAAPGRPRTADAKVDLTAKRLRVQSIPTQNLHADVTYAEGVASYNLEGDSLGGRFKLEGKWPAGAAEPPAKEKKEGAAAPAPPPPPVSEGRFRLEHIRLSRLGEALGLKDSLGPLRGSGDLDLPFHLQGKDYTPVGTGHFTIRNLHWGDAPLTDAIRGVVQLTGQDVRLRDLSATVGEGSFRAAARINLHNMDRSSFSVELERVVAEQLLAPFPDLAGTITGPVDVRLRGHFGREWRATGEAVLTRGTVLGVSVDEWRLPLSLAYAPVSGHGQLAMNDSRAQIGHGQATGDATLEWGSAPRLEGKIRFQNADLHLLLSRNNGLASYAAGKVSGRVDFGAAELRSTDDLTADLNATLSQTPALQLPVLSVLAPYLAPGQSATTFQQGELRARLSRGVVRLQKLNLSSTLLKMSIAGTVTLQGRLDMDVVATTGLVSVNPNFLQLLGVRIPAVGPIPVAVLVQATSYLSNRVIHLRLTGTTRNPVLRTEPLLLLTEEAVRFFLLQSNAPVP